MSDKWELVHADCREVMAMMADNSIGAVVTDPPYELTSITKRFGKAGAAPAQYGTDGAFQRASGGFMGKTWDATGIAFDVAMWAEVLRVLKPGGHMLAFGGTRTFHRMACAIEDAGFEIRDQLAWLYGCLDDQTSAVTSRGVMPYYKIKKGDLVLSYDPSHMSYEWQPVEEVFIYEIEDTVYRISTDFGDQIVSRNHRCLVERGGKEVFLLAEEAARQHEIRVPVLEDVSDLLDALPDFQPGAGATQQIVLGEMCGSCDWSKEEGVRKTSEPPLGQDLPPVFGMRRPVLAEHEARVSGDGAGMLETMQRGPSWAGVSRSCVEGSTELDAGVKVGPRRENDGRNEPGLEGGSDVPEPERELRFGSLRSVPVALADDGAGGRIRHGAPTGGCDRDRAPPDAHGMRASHRSRPAKQQRLQPNVVCDELGSQAIRAWRGHKTVMGRISPEHYRGVIWCVRVKSGAFVAVRNGMAFPTGNSGFPKSLDVSKALDKSRSPLAQQWSGWGTSLKPAMEPICLARKPLTGTVAANVTEWGVGAVNIDGCRIGDDVVGWGGAAGGGGTWTAENSGIGKPGDPRPAVGRFPANVLHDGSVFPEEIARYFYCAKASKRDREEGCEGLRASDSGIRNGSGRANTHPTVKPTQLMQYLCRLITPPGGRIFDPFTGSGSTGKAAMREGFRFIGAEMTEEYIPIARARIQSGLTD